MKAKVKTATDISKRRALLRWHKLHAGVYDRVARKLGVHPSYVSKVIAGRRSSDKIEMAVVAELNRIKDLRPV
jgi:DNA-binding transcriptional regulator YdaS (Cro superfamily)